MIITCNCGEKKFKLPDNSIPPSGRLVQCGYCGLKWKQFPVDEAINTRSISSPKKVVSRPQPVQAKIKKPKKIKKTDPKKTREISLYSPEYLAKKHGININQDNNKKIIKNVDDNKNYGLGFYSSIIILTIFIISFFGILNLTKDIVIFYYPFLESYILYLYETIENIKIIITDFLSIY